MTRFRPFRGVPRLSWEKVPGNSDRSDPDGCQSGTAPLCAPMGTPPTRLRSEARGASWKNDITGTSSTTYDDPRATVSVLDSGSRMVYRTLGCGLWGRCPNDAQTGFWRPWAAGNLEREFCLAQPCGVHRELGDSFRPAPTRCFCSCQFWRFPEQRSLAMPQRSLFQPACRAGHASVRAPGAPGSPMSSPRGSEMGTFRFIDLFAGIGGMRRGFETIGGRCVFTSEWNRFSQETYAANHSCDHPIVGDIREVATEDVPTHDVLLAGFPCQPFSIAGVSKKNALKRPHGFRCEVQGTLFFDIARIIGHHRPQAFLLENVRNLLSHDRGKTFAIIWETLEQDLGYQVDCRVIDARSFVPQHRERVFIVGFRERVPFSFSDLSLPSGDEGPRLRTVLHPEDGTEDPEPPYTVGDQATVSPKYTLSEHLWTYLQAYAEKHRSQGNGFGFGLVGRGDVSRTLSARYYKDGSEILIRRKGQGRPRRLTPRECARLMGFDPCGQPDGGRLEIPVSDTQAYRQLGNAVVVPVVEAVAHHMQPYIQKEQKDLRQLVA